MNTAPVCRTCLASHLRLVDIRGTLLRMFEKLVSSEPNAGDVWLCYICHSLLLKCQRFILMVHRADTMLKAELLPSAPLRSPTSFTRTPTECLSVPVAPKHQPPETRASIKIEPVQVKQESDSYTGQVKTEELTVPSHVTLSIKQEPSEECLGTLWSAENTNKKEEEECLNLFQDEPSDACVSKHTRTYECQTCAKTFSNKYKLKRHTTNVICDKTQTNKCLKCDRTFVRSGSLRKHTARCRIVQWSNSRSVTSQGGRAVCPICNKTLADLSSLRKHVTSHGADKPYTCDYCGKGFAHRTYLITHIRGHNNYRPYSCDTCGKTFAQFGHLSTHRQCHKSKSFRCSVCDKSFSLRVSLNKHRKLHADSLSTDSETLKDKRHEDSDLLTNSDRPNLPKECSLPSKSESWKSNLHEDYSLPTNGNRPKAIFHGDYSLLANSDKPNLPKDSNLPSKSDRPNLPKESSLRTNSDRPNLLDCSLPTKSDRPNFPKVSSLPEERVGLFSCSVCGGAFDSLQRLRRHLAGHAARAARCPLCGDTFSTSGNLNRHTRRKHRNGDTD